MEDKVRILQRLGWNVPSQQQQAMKFHFSLNPVKRADMITDLMNDTFKIQIQLTMLTLYRYVALRQIDVVNLALLGVMRLFLVWFSIQLLKVII